jgi:NosR/NirI family transcriptional regulator, nitrous oxide reductase regulator
MTLVLRVARRASDDAPPVHAEFQHRFEIPGVASYLPVRETPQWLKTWQQRWPDLAVLALGLVVLTLALARQAWLSAAPRRLAAFRIGYLVFTLVFIGYVAQGQLTIVNLTSLIEALSAGRGADFLLGDPIAVVLWGFVALTLFVWGRGTFCGWLCPFGAFQELVSLVGRRVGFKPRHLRAPVDAALKRVKYAVLAALVGAAFTSSAWTARFSEVEPFKTSISMSFQREWPYVAWALLCLAATLFFYRGFCSYLCPLGAGLAVLGKIRLLAWIPRRKECGTPCQTCRHRCEYQAIAPSGRIDYDECFQCLDCVEIHQSDKRCMPLIVQRKHRVIPLRPVGASA